MATCPECATEQAGSRFCGHCGALMPSPAEPSGEPPLETAAEPRRSPVVWTLVALVAVLVAVVVATSRDIGDELAPAQADDRAGEEEPLTSAPPRPETVAGDCPDEEPGCALWRTDLRGAVATTRATPGGDARHAYLGATLPDGTGALYAIDPTNGIQLWRRRLPGRAHRPVVSALGPVVVAYDDPGGGTGIGVFDPHTGELRERIDRALHRRATTAPATAGPVVAVAVPARLLLFRVDGATSRSVELPGTPTALLAIATAEDVTVLVQTGGGMLLAYDADGSLLWDMPSSTLGVGAEGGRSVLLERPGEVVGVDIRRGEVWRTSLRVANVPPVVHHGEILVTTRTGELVRLALTSGVEIGRYPWPVEVGGDGFTRDGAAVYVPTCAGVVAADARDGRERWFAPLEARFGACAGQPTVAGDGHVLVGSGARLYGLAP